jgi:TatD DNase family protein
MLVDTHAHLHFANFAGEVDAVMHRAREAGVTSIINVGVNSADSQEAARLAQAYENVWASVGIHPHEAGEAEQAIGYLRDLAGGRKVVAIGECGLDYFKSHSSQAEQERALRLQVELAVELGLPLIFHVRDAYADFLRIMKGYEGIAAVVHSFTGEVAEMEQVIGRGWYVALNGIMTFTKDDSQLAAAKQLPLERLLLETDCPFLAPKSQRGKRNEPAQVVEIANFLATLRGETFEQLATASTQNAKRLFKI